jgi:hypothetical protein
MNSREVRQRRRMSRYERSGVASCPYLRGGDPVLMCRACRGFGRRHRFAVGADRYGGRDLLEPTSTVHRLGGTRPTSGASAAFILVNSMAGLAGNLASVQNLPDAVPVWAMAAGAGALIGTQLGTRHFQNNGIRRALAAVLVVAGLKLLFA